MVHQLGEIVGIKLDRVGAARLVGGAMAATVVGQHGGVPREPLGDRAPELTVHGDRMNEDGPLFRVPVAVEGIRDPRSVAGRRQLDTHWKSPLLAANSHRGTAEPRLRPAPSPRRGEGWGEGVTKYR